MATDHRPLLDDLRAEQADLARVVTGADLSAPTPADGWDVRDSLAHLAGSDVEAVRAVTDPDGFLALLPSVGADIDGFIQGQVTSRRGTAPEVFLAEWQQGFDAMVDAFAPLDPATKVPWYGPPMSPASFVTARLMEYWAHGQDVVDGLGAERLPTARLRHIAHLGFRTRSFAYANRGLPVPPGDVRVELTAPDGGTWSFGDPDVTDVVAGPALDFCLLVTQRRHREDTALVVTGPVADDWLDVAQVFAGPPGPGRDKRA
ncbi:MAG: TIGR03084 family metal-binding protein [Mycobacteriales bacterium]|nr:TIGR03084 family metal-binding protein [Mycobacteriales bacterium]